MRSLKILSKKLVLQDEIFDLFEKEVTPHGNGAKVLCPKKYIGRKVYVVIRK